MGRRTRARDGARGEEGGPDDRGDCDDRAPGGDGGGAEERDRERRPPPAFGGEGRGAGGSAASCVRRLLRRDRLLRFACAVGIGSFASTLVVLFRLTGSARTEDPFELWGDGPQNRLHRDEENSSGKEIRKDGIRPRVVCFAKIYDGNDPGCLPPFAKKNETGSGLSLGSMPVGGKGEWWSLRNSSGLYHNTHFRAPSGTRKTEECQSTDPYRRGAPPGLSTCNDVHALDLGLGLADGHVEFLNNGAVRDVWAVTARIHGAEVRDEKVVLKTKRVRKYENGKKLESLNDWSPRRLELMRHDLLISERAGLSPLKLEEALQRRGAAAHSNVLPTHQYCAFSSVAPRATLGTLKDYVRRRKAKKDWPSAEEQLALATQAARGLHQSQLYAGGGPTHLHNDLNAGQYLVFGRDDVLRRGSSDTARTENVPPLVLLNDFNSGSRLTARGELCHVKKAWPGPHVLPLELIKHGRLSRSIDVFTLGNVFFFLLSDGQMPRYRVGKGSATASQVAARMLKGERPELPRDEDYRQYGNESVSIVRERSRHPAFLALTEVMERCRALKPEDRPSSLEVVTLLEEVHNFQSSH